jgi:Carboxypeptidase regulatory-like domain
MRRPGLRCHHAVLVVALLFASGSSPSAQTLPATPSQLPQPTVRAQRPPRDPRVPQERGTANVSGRVVQQESGAPVRYAQVMLSGRAERMVETDDEGRYSFTDLPAGPYRLHARKDGFVEQFFRGARSRARSSSKSVTLTDGQALDRIDLGISRGGVITGVVTDEAGEPIVSVQVRAAPRGALSSGMFGMPGQTDDQGRYRLHSLPDGDYLVVVEARRQFGPDMSPPVTTGYVRTYYPGSPDRTAADAVAVEAGREAVANFTLTPRRLVSISGSVRSASGLGVGDVALSLRRRGELEGGGSWSGAGPHRAGQFTFGAVAPGEYIITARLGGGFGPRRANADDRQPPEMGEVFLDVGDEPLTGVVITTAPGASISGRIVWDGDRTRPPTEPETTMGMGMRMGVTGPPGSAPMTARVMASPLKREAAFGPPSDGEVGKDDRFSISGVFGDVRLDVFGLPPGWLLKAVETPAGDVARSGLKTKPGESISDVRIVVTNKLARLSGRVTDERGQPADEAMVVLLDPDTKEAPAALVLPSGVTPVQDGAYRVTTGRAGSYLVVALETQLFSLSADPDFVAKLRSVATEVTLVEDQQQQLDLTVVKIPD